MKKTVSKEKKSTAKKLTKTDLKELKGGCFWLGKKPPAPKTPPKK